MPRKGTRIGDVRIASQTPHKVEILVRSRNGGTTWMPYKSFILQHKVGQCPDCMHTDELRYFVPDCAN